MTKLHRVSRRDAEGAEGDASAAEGAAGGAGGAGGAGEVQPDQSRADAVQRWDRQPLLKPSIRMDNGRMFVQGFVAKPGVLIYRTGDGIEIRELVPPEELHDPRSLETLAQAPVTLEHPRVDVDSTNVDQLAVGNVGDEVQVLRDNGFVRVNMVIRRDDAIQTIRRRDKGELSPGYTVLIDPTPGVHPEFGRYDAIQRGRRYNHLALTTAARGGHEIKLRADAAIQVIENPPPARREAPMILKLLLPILLSGLATAGVARADADEIVEPLRGFDESRDDASAAGALMMTALTKAFDAVSGQLATVTGERDALQTKVDQSTGDADEDEEPKHDALMKFHQERLTLETLAAAHKLDTADEAVRKLDNAELRVLIVKAIKPDVDLEARGDSADAYCRAFLELNASGKSRSDAAWSQHTTADPKVGKPGDDAKREDGTTAPKTTGEAHLRSLDSAFNERKPARV